jgi:anti-sigma factor RsiW
MNIGHIPFEQLVERAEGRLDGEARAATLAHATACPTCAAEVAWLVRVIGLMRADPCEEPPPRVAESISRMFQVRAQPPRRQVVVALRFDSALVPLAAGRRAGPSDERQMVFSAEGFVLDLRIAPTGPRWAVLGQVFGAEQRGQVELRGSGGTLHADVSTVGEFVFPEVPRGTHTLILYTASAAIAIEALEVGA